MKKKNEKMQVVIYHLYDFVILIIIIIHKQLYDLQKISQYSDSIDYGLQAFHSTIILYQLYLCVSFGKKNNFSRIFFVLYNAINSLFLHHSKYFRVIIKIIHTAALIYYYTLIGKLIVI